MTYLPQGTKIKMKEGHPYFAHQTGKIIGISTLGQPVIGVGYIIAPDAYLMSVQYPYWTFCAFESMFEVIQ